MVPDNILFDTLQLLSTEANESFDSFLADKRTSNVKGYNDRVVLLERAATNPERFVQFILNNYGFRSNHRFRKTMVVEIDLPAVFQKLAIVNGDFKFQSGNFRDSNWVKTGCLGETAFLYLMNCMLHFFKLETRIPFVTKQSLLYGGDGGDDFRFGSMILDIKYRDDNPAKGIALQNSFLKSSLRAPQALLVQMSNITNDRKLGHSVVNTPLDKIDKELPLALVGYTSVEEYDQRKTRFDGGFSDWIVDDLNSSADLVLKLVAEINDSEGMFEL